MKILIPTDFSPTSQTLIEKVLESLKDKGPSEILLLNTFIVKETDPELVITANDRLKSQSKNSLEALKSLTLQKITNPQINVQTASHMGSLRNVIQQLLKKEKFDHIAVTKDQAGELSSIREFLKEKACAFIIK